MNTGVSSVDLALSKKVSWLLGLTVFMVLNPRPTSPSTWPSLVKLDDTCCAHSIAWLGTVRPPTVTLSV